MIQHDSEFDRRRFLGWSAASLTALGLTGWGASSAMPPVFRRIAAAAPASGKKVLFIFLRGGMDAVQTVIPFGDAGLGPKAPSYAEARPRLGVDPSAAHDLNGFASFHPALQGEAPADPKLADIFHDRVDARGARLAVLHRIGYESQNRSHFSSQQFWENGVPGAVKLEEGVFNRYLTAYRDESSPLQAATLNNNQVVMMKGPTLVPVLRSIDDFALPGNVPLGRFPSPGDPLGAGLQGAWGQSEFNRSIPGNELTYSTGRSLLEGLQFFEENVRDEPYQPAESAQAFYDAMTDRPFAGFVRDCARLLKQVDSLQIIGCNQNGYDTHGVEDRNFPTLMRNLGLALTALYHDLESVWDDTIVITMSEFGRTSLENGNLGTDHGEASAMLAMGGSILGGVYNADPGRWANGDLFSTANGRYLAHRTDFRQVYAELINGHLGDPQSRIDTIIPGYSALQGENVGGYFTPLGFVAGA